MFILKNANLSIIELENKLRKLEVLEAVRLRKPYIFNPRFISLLNNQQYKIKILKDMIRAKKNT